MPKSSGRVLFEELRSRDSSTVTGSYQVVGSVFDCPLVLVKIVNDSDAAITVSYDGTTDQDYLPANSFVVYDFNTNSYNPQVGGNGLSLADGKGVYVKGSAGTGDIYVVGVSAG